MAAIEITRREVLNNLIRFKDNLLEMHVKEKASGKKEERVYKILLNRRTGDMRFAQKISSLEQHFPRKAKGAPEDWKEVRLIVDRKSNHAPVHFEVRDMRDQGLKPADVEALAWRIVSETLEVLNIKGKEVGPATSPEILPEEIILQDLSSIHLAPQGARIEDLPGWAGSLNRMEAERKLGNKTLGTYLLREGDPVTLSLAFQLSLSNRLSIDPYVLTIVEKGKKISECLICHTEKGWFLYGDEPRLGRYHFYPTPQALIRELIPFARHPLYTQIT